jgi:ABC-type phosphate transport system substrate-binding protein
MATAQMSTAATNAPTRGYPTSTYPNNHYHYPVYQRMYFGFHRFANSTFRTTYVAGGATLPAVGYEGSTATTNNPSTPVAGSVFGYFQSVLSGNNTVIQYCQTGSGFGKKVYDGLAGATAGVNGPCAALGVKPGSTNGFGAPSALALPDPDIVGSDSPLTGNDPVAGEYNIFLANKGASRTEPVELPEISGSVSIFYNNVQTGSTQIHLTDAQICGMVLGTITNWSSLGFPSKTLKFVYRSDGSGTTFSFSNHLQAVCGSSSISTAQNFTGAAPPNVNVVAVAPPSSIGASGNPGVVSTVTSTDGAIGYAEAANALSARVPASGINFALVNGFDPIKNLPEAAAKLNGVTSIVKDSIVVVSTGHGATTAAISPAPTHAGCVLLVKPSAYANLSGGYPIVAVSYQLYGYSGNGTNNTRLRTLAQELTKSGIVYNNQSGTKNITTVDAATSTVGTGTTGFSNLGTSFQTPVKTASNACINT